MGKVMSMVARKANRFNVENRAHRILEREKPIPAPKYESALRDMERTLELDSKFVEKISKKDAGLDNRLKSVYVTSQDNFIDYRNQKPNELEERPLPLDRTTPGDFEYGFKESGRIAHGRCSLRQAIQFITDHQNNPDMWSVAKISNEYRIKEPVVEDILKYFKTFNVYLPEQKYQDKLLTQTKNKQLPDNADGEQK